MLSTSNVINKKTSLQNKSNNKISISSIIKFQIFKLCRYCDDNHYDNVCFIQIKIIMIEIKKRKIRHNWTWRIKFENIVRFKIDSNKNQRKKKRKKKLIDDCFLSIFVNNFIVNLNFFSTFFIYLIFNIALIFDFNLTFFTNLIFFTQLFENDFLFYNNVTCDIFSKKKFSYLLCIDFDVAFILIFDKCFRR